MERLTKRNKTYYDLYEEEVTDLLIGDWYEKLSVLEDTEEELGCPIDVLFKALKTTVFTNAEDCYGQELPSGLREFEVRLNAKNMSLGLIHNSMFKGKEVIRHIPLKDYKKTWWLKEDKSE